MHFSANIALGKGRFHHIQKANDCSFPRLPFLLIFVVVVIIQVWTYRDNLFFASDLVGLREVSVYYQTISESQAGIPSITRNNNNINGNMSRRKTIETKTGDRLRLY